MYVSQRIGSPALVFDDSGNYIRSWDSGEITDPHGFHIADDVVYVADRTDSVVLKCTLEGKILQTVGQRGKPSDTGCEKRGDLVLRAAGPFISVQTFPSTFRRSFMYLTGIAIAGFTDSQEMVNSLPPGGSRARRSLTNFTFLIAYW